MWLWPVLKFWTFFPQGWVLALVWNIFEILHLKMPFAGWAFGIIIGYKGEKVGDNE